MAKFIELPLVNGETVCVNVDYIEAVHAVDENTCTVYMAFICPDACEQDYYKVNLSYNKTVSRLYERGC